MLNDISKICYVLSIHVKTLNPSLEVTLKPYQSTNPQIEITSLKTALSSVLAVVIFNNIFSEFLFNIITVMGKVDGFGRLLL